MTAARSLDAQDRAARIARVVLGRKHNRKGWVRADCPFCLERAGKADRKSSFGFNVRTSVYSCYRCGAGGRVAVQGVSQEYAADLDPSLDGEEAVGPGIAPPEGFWALAGATARGSVTLAPALSFLAGRGVSPETIARWGLGACVRGRYAGRIIIPIRGDDGTLLWFVARRWVKKCSKPYLYPLGDRGGVMFNHGALFREDDAPALVVEGCFDAIPYAPDDGVGSLGTPENPEPFLAARRPVVFVLDGDAKDKAWAMAMKLRLAGRAAGSVWLPPGVDPDEVPADVVRLASWRALRAPSGETRL